MTQAKKMDVLATLQSYQVTAWSTIEREGDWQHWQLRPDGEVVWLIFDRADSAVNVVDETVLLELKSIVEQLRNRSFKKLILTSAKRSGFCAGADIGMFRGMSDQALAVEKLRQAHEVVDSLESLNCFKLALIEGNCLGGGLELALACDYRIAVKGSRLGFPEVQLGLHPGLGGTFRSCELLGSKQALPLMLTGRSLRAPAAKSLGLVDEVVEQRHAQSAVLGRDGKRSSDGGWTQRLSSLLESAPARQLLAAFMEKQTAKKVSRSHYPAPFQLIELWRDHGGDRRAMQRAEIDSFAQLVTSDEGQNLVRVFFLREALKAQIGESPSLAIKHVHVIGAGAMGGDIAVWAAYCGLIASVSDRSPEMIASTMARAADLAGRKRLRGSQRQAFFDRLIPDPSGISLPQADLIIEAVPEKLAIKQAVYAEVEKVMKPTAILATNTSSIPLESLRECVSCPDRFIGMHFFNPVSKMQLIEVVEHDQVSSETRNAITAAVGSLDRLPVPVKSYPGFLVNRVLTPYLLEAMVMLDEGVEAEALDAAAVKFGMPMGPVELADQVGLDVCVAVAETLHDSFDHPLPAVPSWVMDKINAGDLGKKSGKGLYEWEKGKPKKSGEISASVEQTTDRLVMPLLNTAMECLRKGIVADAQVLDGALIFGTGFAPFRGGPLHYAKQRGVDDIVRVLQSLQQTHGPRFTPDPGWQEHV